MKGGQYGTNQERERKENREDTLSGPRDGLLWPDLLRTRVSTLLLMVAKVENIISLYSFLDVDRVCSYNQPPAYSHTIPNSLIRSHVSSIVC